MQLENVRKWLDAVDQDHLDPLDQWGVSPLRHPSQTATLGTNTISRDADSSPSQLNPIPPSGILLRNGTVRVTRQKSKATAHNDEKDIYTKSRVSSFPTSAAQDLENEDPSQTPAPGIYTGSDAMDHTTRQLQTSGAEGTSDSLGVKRLPTFRERARLHLPGVSRPTPVIQVEVTDPVAVNCQGAKVVGGPRQNGLRRLVDRTRTSRRNTTDWEGALHRSNALRRPSNVRAEDKSGAKN